MADIRKPRRTDYLTGMTSPNTADSVVNALMSQMQENINALSGRLADALVRIAELERRKSDTAVTQETRKVSGGANIGKNVRPLGSYTTPGGSGAAAAENHQHACVAYVKDYKADLPSDLKVDVPSTAYVRSEKRYYKWVSGAWVTDELYFVL